MFTNVLVKVYIYILWSYMKNLSKKFWKFIVSFERFIIYNNRLQRCFMIVFYYVQFTMQNAKYTMSAQHWIVQYNSIQVYNTCLQV